MPALAPVAFGNRVGVFITVGGSSANTTYGKVSTNLIGAAGTAADVLTHDYITEPIADGVRSFFFRFPHGEWLTSGGDNWIVRYHDGADGFIPIDATGIYNAKEIAAERGQTRLTTGWGTTYAGLQAQSCAITTYHGCPPPLAPSGPGSVLGWPTDVLAQTGYTTAAEVADQSYHETLYTDELNNGVTEIAFDEAGAMTSPNESGATLFPLWAGTSSFTGGYARQVCAEANPTRSTSAWLTPYTFTANYSTFTARVGDTDYLQPSEMGQLPMVLIRGQTLADWNQAMEMAPYYRVRVKWAAMKDVVGASRMADLLALGAATVQTPTEATVTTTGPIYLSGRAAVTGRHR